MSRPDIFGVGLADLLAEAFADAEGAFPLVLRRRVGTGRDAANPTSGMIDQITDYPCTGFVDSRDRAEAEGTVTDLILVIFGASLPGGVEPEPRDLVSAAHEGTVYEIKPGGVMRDPAGATYTCQATATPNTLFGA